MKAQRLLNPFLHILLVIKEFDILHIKAYNKYSVPAIFQAVTPISMLKSNMVSFFLRKVKKIGRASSKALPILKYIIKIINLIPLCFSDIIYITFQKYTFSSKPPRKSKEISNLPANNLDINYNQSSPCGPIPHNMAKTFDGPPSIERSGSEHRRAVTSFLLRRKAWLEVELSLQERRRGRKVSTKGGFPLLP